MSTAAAPRLTRDELETLTRDMLEAHDNMTKLRTLDAQLRAWGAWTVLVRVQVQRELRTQRNLFWNRAAELGIDDARMDAIVAAARAIDARGD